MNYYTIPPHERSLGEEVAQIVWSRGGSINVEKFASMQDAFVYYAALAERTGFLRRIDGVYYSRTFFGAEILKMLAQQAASRTGRKSA